VLFVNNPDYFDDSYQRFMVNRFRELLPYAEVPIRLQIRGKGEQEERRAKGKTIDAQVNVKRKPRSIKPKLKGRLAPKRARRR
jgi:hypothetical protein